MSNLAIKGHPTRGKEVIEILKMLGGRNPIMRDGTNTEFYYSIDKNGVIQWVCNAYNHYFGITLEQFLEKFPYKVGDKVKTKVPDIIGTIINMRWVNNENTIVYEVEWNDDTKHLLGTIDDCDEYYKTW